MSKKIKDNKNSKKKKKKKKHTFLKVVITLILLIALAAGAFVGYSTVKNGWGAKGMIQTVLGQSEQKLKDLDPFTVLCLGVSEDIQSKLTDTIIVASYNPKTQKATLISIPRDTFVGTNKKKATSYDKINALYQKSPAKTLEAVNKITGLDITYYIVISNNALVELVDTIGGVEFYVPKDMSYDDWGQGLHIHLTEGLQKLNGEQAEGVVRYRKDNNGKSYSEEYGDNDLGRMRTQRDFIKAVLQQSIQLKNITKIGNFIDIFKNNVTTNIKNWSLIKDYIPYALDFNIENLQMEAIPGTTPNLKETNGVSIFVHNEKETKELVERLFNEQNGTGEEEIGEDGNSTNIENVTGKEETSKNKDIKIELLNGSGKSALLTKAVDALKKQGYNVYKTGTTNSTAKTTIINRTAVPAESISNIKNILKCGTTSNSTTSNTEINVRIILGKDYE